MTTAIVAAMVLACFAALFLLAGLLRADDTKPIPLATVEELQKKVAEQQKEMAAKDQQIAKLSQKLTIYQQSAFRCQDAMLDAQIDAQARQSLPPAKDNAQHAAPVPGRTP